MLKGAVDSTYDGNTYLTGCLTRCHGNQIVFDNGTCSGIGCCKVDIPPRMTNISVKASFFNTSSELPSLNCRYSFVAKKDSYTFSSTHLQSNGFPFMELAVVLDWAVGELHENCRITSSNNKNYACKNNTKCDDSDTDFGYRCRCKEGYAGNPYLHPNGCTGSFLFIQCVTLSISSLLLLFYSNGGIPSKFYLLW